VRCIFMRRFALSLGLIWGALFAFPLLSNGAVTILEDNFIYRASGDAVQTNGPSLTAKGPPPSQSNSRTIYLKFDLSTASVSDGIYANLLLTTTGTAGTDFTLSLYALNSGVTGYDWSQTSITWNNSPGLGSDAFDLDASKTTYLGDFTSLASGTASGTGISTYFAKWDDYLQSDDSMTLIVLVKTQTDAGPSIGFASSENASSSSQPQLTFSNVPEPSRAILMMGGLLSLFAIRRRPLIRPNIPA
jgi:hypothetical protein